MLRRGRLSDGMDGLFFFKEFAADEGQGAKQDEAEHKGFQEQAIKEEAETGKEESCNAYAEESVMDKVA